MAIPRIALLGAPALLIGLAACQPAGQPAQDAEQATATNELHQQLLDMPEGQRNAVFIRALRDAGQECQHVVASGYQQEHGGLPMWAARCSDGGEWAFFITQGGEAQVVDCDIAARAGIPACRIDAAASEPAQQVDDPEGPAVGRQ